MLGPIVDTRHCVPLFFEKWHSMDFIQDKKLLVNALYCDLEKGNPVEKRKAFAVLIVRAKEGGD